MVQTLKVADCSLAMNVMELHLKQSAQRLVTLWQLVRGSPSHHNMVTVITKLRQCVPCMIPMNQLGVGVVQQDLFKCCVPERRCLRELVACHQIMTTLWGQAIQSLWVVLQHIFVMKVILWLAPEFLLSLFDVI